MALHSATAYKVLGFLSLNLWGRLSASVQRVISATISRLYETSFSRLMIAPYCLWQFGSWFHYCQFVPGGGKSRYETFQDFFTRDFASPPIVSDKGIWPCEGFLCEKGKVSEIPHVKVKGEVRNLRTVFGGSGPEIPNDYHFTNIFLHNKNYHHIHSPVSGVVKSVEHIPGELLLLRPWAYRKTPSLPALTNERVNVSLQDDQNQKWYLSIVGGPMVATINRGPGLKEGHRVAVGEKIASFRLGSTLCMVSPVPPAIPAGIWVSVGHPLLQHKPN